MQRISTVAAMRAGVLGLAIGTLVRGDPLVVVLLSLWFSEVVIRAAKHAGWLE